MADYVNEGPRELPLTDDHVLISMRENAKLLLEEDYKKKETDKLNEVQFDDVEKKYLSQYLLYQDRKNMVTLEEQASVAKTVEQCVAMVVNRLHKHTDFAGGYIMRCGSFFEDTKVGDAHEFDFQYILPLKDFTAEKAHMSKLKAKNSNLDSNTFFRLYKKRGTKEEENETDVVEQLGEEIIAKDKHDSFKLAVEGILKDLFNVNDEIIMTKKAGPAVKFVLTIPYIASKNGKQKDLRYVKIDLTVAYEPHPVEEFFEQLQFRSYATFLRGKEKLQCQFIPAHDFWKLSFTKNEKNLMRTVAGVDMEGVCYRAIKRLRDAVDVQDFLGDGILASYPIKVSHIKRTMNTHFLDIDNQWTKEKVGENVINVAKAVDRDGHRQQLHGLFIRGDNVFGESDKSYMESRRIVNELKYISTGFKRYALVNLIIWALLLVASTGLLVSEIVAWAVTDWLDLEMNCFNFTVGDDPPFPLDLPFLFTFTIFVWIVLLSNLAGICLVSVVTAQWEKDIFKVLPNLRYVFSVNFVASFALGVFDIFLIVDYINNDSCTRLGNSLVIQLVAGVSLFITSIPFILLLISCISSSTYHRGMCNNCSCWDVLFFEFPFCREIVDRYEDEKLNGAQFNKGFSDDDVSELRGLLRDSIARTRPEDVFAENSNEYF